MKEPKYTSRIIKASALLPDTKVLLTSWDLDASVTDNLTNARQANIFGKASRARVEDILRIFRQRYFTDPEVGEALVTLIQGNAPGGWIDPLLYYFSVQNDRTLKDIILEIVYPRRMVGHTDIRVELITRAIRDWVAEGKTTSPWSEETIMRVARNSMAALRDFGILSGAAKKSINSIYLPTESFALLAFEFMRKKGSGEKVLTSEEWNLFFLPIDGVERFFLEAHQERLLSYQAAGSVIRLEFPAENLVEYAHVLVERARA